MDLSNIINYDNLSGIDDNDHYSRSFWGPKQPFRLLIIGPSSCGKSVILLNLIFRVIHWNRLWLFCKDIKESKMIYLQNQMDILQKKFDKQCSQSNIKSYRLFSIHVGLSELPDLDEINKENDPMFHTCVVINDLVLDKQWDINQFFLRSRHRGVSIIYISQFYFKIDKKLRENASDIYLFRSTDLREVRRLANVFAHRVTVDEFIQLYNEATMDQYSFMNIDLRTKFIEKHIRRNFCGCYIGKHKYLGFN